MKFLKIGNFSINLSYIVSFSFNGDILDLKTEKKLYYCKFTEEEYQQLINFINTPETILQFKGRNLYTSNDLDNPFRRID